MHQKRLEDIRQEYARLEEEYQKQLKAANAALQASKQPVSDSSTTPSCSGYNQTGDVAYSVVPREGFDVPAPRPQMGTNEQFDRGPQATMEHQHDRNTDEARHLDEAQRLKRENEEAEITL